MAPDFITLNQADFATMAACADAAHLLAVTTGALVRLIAHGGLYAEFFGHGVRCENVPFVPYVSGYLS